MPICINFGSNLLKLIAIVTLRKRLEDRRIFMNWSLLKVPSLPANLTTLVRLKHIYSKKFSIAGSAMIFFLYLFLPLRGTKVVHYGES